MESRVVEIYRCKMCSTPVRQPDLRQSHLHWHGITDKNVDAHFVKVEEVESGSPPPGSAGTDAGSGARKSGPSLGVLVVSLGLLAVMGVVYVMTK